MQKLCTELLANKKVLNEFPSSVIISYSGAIPKGQALEKETPLNNILVSCLAWLIKEDVKVNVKKHQTLRNSRQKKSLSEETQEIWL